MKISLFKIAAIFFLVIFLAGYSASDTGKISPGLKTKISGMNPDTTVQLIIALKGPVSSKSLKSRLKDNYKSRAEHHRAGLESLKNQAALSQAGLLDFLNQNRSLLRAKNIKSHWIINVVTAELAVSEIEKLASREDVEKITVIPQMRSLETKTYPADKTSLSPSALNIEPNISLIGADSAWALGYTGAGRLVCSFDTGIEGNHPALFDRWKGHDGDSAAAWYDPIDGATFPHVFYPYQVGSSAVYHGTQSMGIMIGYDYASEWAPGVAPDAKWISAGVVNLFGASYIDAFEWACDPDGDPNTIDDIPDVINHSWGFENDDLDCDDYFYQVIDNTEALGIVNIFAAGNSGPSTLSIVNPANRARNSLDCFAVGAIDYRDGTLSSFSSIGPSDCDGVSIKPNVVAPGQFIKTTGINNSFEYVQGTSFSAPHVSGAVAILKQYAPDATVDEIKEALLTSCMSYPAWGTVPNNEFGYGMIYIPAALEALAPQSSPDLYVGRFDYGPVMPGDLVSAPVVIQNKGGQINNVYGLIGAGDGLIQYTTDSLYFGNIDALDSATSHISFVGLLEDTLTAGTEIELNFSLHGENGYDKTVSLTIQVGEKPQKGFYTHQNDILSFTVSNFGQYGFAYSTFNPLGYDGFRYIYSDMNNLFEAAFMIGNDSNHISDGARTVATEPDNDFAIAPGGEMKIFTPGSIADQETYSIFNDGDAEHPLGLEITQQSFSWNDTPDDNFIILQYIIRNITDTAVNNIYAGLFFDWNLQPSTWLDASGYDTTYNLGYIYHPYVGLPYYTQARYRGLSVLNDEGVVSHKIDSINQSVNNYSLSETKKYRYLSDGTFESFDKTWYNLAHVISTGPYDLAPGQMDTAIFAIVAADSSLNNLLNSAEQARSKYLNGTDIAAENQKILPEQFELRQNYPNPFNPSTTISFALKSRADVRLSIYNILGEKLIDLVDKNLSVGEYEVSWDGRDKRGDYMSSGIYLYRLAVDGQSQAKKMILLK